jgi:hypothetical protein
MRLEFVGCIIGIILFSEVILLRLLGAKLKVVKVNYS